MLLEKQLLIKSGIQILVANLGCKSWIQIYLALELNLHRLV